MNKTRVLIIEDDKAIKSLIATTLEMHDYHYMWADRGEQGILSTASQWPDIILLDLGLPDMDGVDVTKEIRSWSKIPIIVINIRDKDNDKIATLDAGADDHLTKPLSVDELLARLRTAQGQLSYMQSLKEDQSSTFINGGLIIDYTVGYAILDGEELHLTPYKYKLLCLLAHNVGKVLTRSYIIRGAWGAAWKGDMASPRVFMASLRKRIKRIPLQPQYVQTHVGVGCRMSRQ